MPEPIYTRVSNSSAVFDVSPSTIYRWYEGGLINIYKRGKFSFVSVAEVCAFIEGRDGLEQQPEG